MAKTSFLSESGFRTKVSSGLWSSFSFCNLFSSSSYTFRVTPPHARPYQLTPYAPSSEFHPSSTLVSTSTSSVSSLFLLSWPPYSIFISESQQNSTSKAWSCSGSSEFTSTSLKTSLSRSFPSRCSSLWCRGREFLFGTRWMWVQIWSRWSVEFVWWSSCSVGWRGCWIGWRCRLGFWSLCFDEWWVGVCWSRCLCRGERPLAGRLTRCFRRLLVGLGSGVCCNSWECDLQVDIHLAETKLQSPAPSHDKTHFLTSPTPNQYWDHPSPAPKTWAQSTHKNRKPTKSKSSPGPTPSKSHTHSESSYTHLAKSREKSTLCFQCSNSKSSHSSSSTPTHFSCRTLRTE